MIDAHQHFWTAGDGRYDYPPPDDGVLYRTFLPEHLAPLLRAAGVDRTIAVQAVDREWETEYLLGLAREFPFIAGVVGWCDLAAANAAEVVARYRAAGPLVGIRPMLQKQASAAWLLTDVASENLRILGDENLVLEALIDVRHIEMIVAVAELHPDLTVVVDHMAKPWRHPDRIEEWTSGMRKLSQSPNTAVKISGYPFEQNADDAEFRRLCRFFLDCYSSHQLIWGSDWPVSTRHLPYASCASRAKAAFDPGVWARIAACNSERIYRLDAAGT
jgi:L-fuconolactonase